MSVSLARRGASARRHTQSEGGGGDGGDGGFYANAINNPSAAGYPDETNTGVPSGVTLTTTDRIVVTTNGAVIENYYVTEQIYVQANNVTIRNCRIETGDYYPIRNEGTDLLVEDCEIIGTSDNVTAGISFDNYTARRVHVHGAADGLKANANVLIEDSYITGLRVSEGSHNDGIQTTGGTNVTVRHNTVKLGDIASANAAIQLGDEWGTNTNWLVENNLFDGGGWTINNGNQTFDSSMRVINNRFTRRYGYGVGSFPGGVWTGNYFDDDGTPAGA